MRIENINVFLFNSKKMRQIKTRIRVRNNLIEMAPNTLRIKDLSLLTRPLLMSNNSNANPVKMIAQPITQVIKSECSILPAEYAAVRIKGNKIVPIITKLTNLLELVICLTSELSL